MDQLIALIQICQLTKKKLSKFYPDVGMIFRLFHDFEIF